MPFAQVDLRNYAPKGAEVSIISTSIDGVCIVEHAGNRFPCRKEDLSDNSPSEDIIETDKGFKLF